ncbi:hypothetical protein D3C84_834100 [compost metagenome]
MLLSQSLEMFLQRLPIHARRHILLDEVHLPFSAIKLEQLIVGDPDQDVMKSSALELHLDGTDLQARRSLQNNIALVGPRRLQHPPGSSNAG